MKSIEQMSYQEYRKHMEELAFEKKKLQDMQSKKKLSMAEYRKQRQIYLKTLADEREQVLKLMDKIPEKY